MRISDLAAAEYNPRVISDEALAGLAESVGRFGLVEPIVVNIRGGCKRIVGGHQRVRVLADAGVDECVCMAVDLSEADEKMLNLALNNPRTQGEFIDGMDAYIEALRADVGDEGMEALRIAELHEALAGPRQPMQREKINLRPYKQAHVLLSFAPGRFVEIQEYLEAIRAVEGVEYVQSAN